MCSTTVEPLDHPAILFRKRSPLPEFLHVMIDGVVSRANGGLDGTFAMEHAQPYFAKRTFSWSHITRTCIEAHLNYKTREVEGSSFVSAYKDEATALRPRPFFSPPEQYGRTKYITKLIIDTNGLVPAWACTTDGTQIPVWIEQGTLPKVPKGVLQMTPEAFDAFEASTWICLGEIRAVLGLEADISRQNEWFACGYIPKNMICGQVVVEDAQTSIGGLSDNRRDDIMKLERRKNVVDSGSKDVLQEDVYLPQIPIRTSSLRSHRSYESSEMTMQNTRVARWRSYRTLTTKVKRMIGDAQLLLRKILKRAQHELRKRAPAAEQSKPSDAGQKEVGQDYGADEDWSAMEPHSETYVHKNNGNRRLTVRASECGPGLRRRSYRGLLQYPQTNIGSVAEEIEHATISHDVEVSQRTSVTLPASDPSRHDVIQNPEKELRSEPSASARSRSIKTPQTERHAHLFPTVYTPPDTPPAPQSQSEVILQKAQLRCNKGDELRARLADTKKRCGYLNQQQDHADLSNYYIPEEICSESVLNEPLDLPMPTPAASSTNSETASLASLRQVSGG